MAFSPDALAVFDAMREGILVIDTAGVIRFGNAAYRRFLRAGTGREPGEIVGQRLRDLRPGAQLPENVGPAARDTTSLYDRVRRFERAEIRRGLSLLPFGIRRRGRCIGLRSVCLSGQRVRRSSYRNSMPSQTPSSIPQSRPVPSLPQWEFCCKITLDFSSAL